jgi:hypothetical protein
MDHVFHDVGPAAGSHFAEEITRLHAAARCDGRAVRIPSPLTNV